MFGLDCQGKSYVRGRICNWPVKGGHNLDLQVVAVKTSQDESHREQRHLEWTRIRCHVPGEFGLRGSNRE